MLAPLPSVEAFRRDAVSDGVELDDGVAAGWLESATRLERAAMTRHFGATSRYEWMFWDMGLRREVWPL